MSQALPARCPAPMGLVHNRIRTLATISLSATGSRKAPKGVLWSWPMPSRRQKLCPGKGRGRSTDPQTHPLASQVSIQPVCEASCQKDEGTDEGAFRRLAVPCCASCHSVPANRSWRDRSLMSQAIPITVTGIAATLPSVRAVGTVKVYCTWSDSFCHIPRLSIPSRLKQIHRNPETRTGVPCQSLSSQQPAYGRESVSTAGSPNACSLGSDWPHVAGRVPGFVVYVELMRDEHCKGNSCTAASTETAASSCRVAKREMLAI